MTTLLLPCDGSPNALLGAQCDRILMGTARRSSLVHAAENSLTTRVLEHSSLPVEMIDGAPMGSAKRLCIPTGVGAGLALRWVSGA